MKNLLFLLLWCCATIATAQKITTPNIQPAAKVACSIALTATVTEAGCTGQSNGTVSLFAANGATPYAYAWSNGAATANLTNLAVGLYTVTVTDALGCTATKIANIQNGSPINANNTANGNPSTIPIMACVGDVIKFSSSGVIPTGTAVEWYISPTAAFTPPTGTYIGTTNTTLCPTICPKIQVIFIDACNGTTSEFDNEYMVFTSGDGFQADNLQVKYSNSSLAGNAALNIGANACALQVPQAALITALRAGACNASNIIPVNPGSTVPAGGVVVLFCSKAVR